MIFEGWVASYFFIPTESQHVFKIFGEVGRKLKLCPSLVLDPSDPSAWNL